MARSAGITIAILLLACGCLARYGVEKKFDLYATLGYGFGVGGRYAGASETTIPNTPAKREDHYQNFGWGIKLEGGADYLLMENLYGQAGLCYSIGVPWFDNVTDDGTTRTTVSCHWSTLGIKALLKPTFKFLDLFDVYTGFGLGLYFAFSSADIKQTPTNYSAKEVDGNNPVLAFIGSLGVEYPLTESIIMYGELYCEQMSFTMTKTDYTNSSFPKGDPYAPRTVTYHEDENGSPYPPKTPGTNVAIRVGMRFPIF